MLPEHSMSSQNMPGKHNILPKASIYFINVAFFLFTYILLMAPVDFLDGAWWSAPASYDAGKYL